MKRIVLILFLSIFLQGCLVFMANVAGYQETKAKYTKLYDAYKIETEQINIEREKNGLPPEPMKEFKAWVREQPLTYNEIKLFKERGVISREDAKALRAAIKEMEKNELGEQEDFSR